MTDALIVAAARRVADRRAEVETLLSERNALQCERERRHDSQYPWEPDVPLPITEADGHGYFDPPVDGPDEDWYTEGGKRTQERACWHKDTHRHPLHRESEPAGTYGYGFEDVDEYEFCEPCRLRWVIHPRYVAAKRRHAHAKATLTRILRRDRGDRLLAAETNHGR